MLRRRFSRDEAGTTAIEFALIAPVLFFMLFCTAEIAILGLVSSNLDNAVLSAARAIRTGQASGATSAAGFETAVCTQMGGDLTDCRERLRISVQRFTGFAAARTGGVDPLNDQFDRGQPGDIILVRADYRWMLVTPFVGPAYGRTAPTEVRLDARAAFKNEPYL